jgi:hypothetical protein
VESTLRASPAAIAQANASSTTYILKLFSIFVVRKVVSFHEINDHSINLLIIILTIPIEISPIEMYSIPRIVTNRFCALLICKKNLLKKQARANSSASLFIYIQLRLL